MKISTETILKIIRIYQEIKNDFVNISITELKEIQRIMEIPDGKD